MNYIEQSFNWVKKSRRLRNLKLLRKPLSHLLFLAMAFSFTFPILTYFQITKGGFLEELCSHALAAIILIFFTTFVVLWKNGHLIEAMVRARENSHIEPNDGPLNVMFEKSFSDAVARIDSLNSKSGLALSNSEEGNDELNLIVNSCFCLRYSAYIAIDSHVPSLYYKLYPQFLADHKVGQAPRVFSWRILAAEQADLIKDYNENRNLFEQFLQWHTDNGVMLGQISPQAAKKYADLQHIETTDMGLWSRWCSILFIPPKTESQPLTLRYVPSSDKHYNNCKSYFRNVALEANGITLNPQGVLFEVRTDQQKNLAAQQINSIN